jgi:amino acid transporter
MIRGLGLRGALAVNVITMIGIGPLITIPLVLTNLHGSLALAGWLVGALIALCDGLAWAELGSLYPGSGGTYVFLREAFGRDRWGRLLGFMFAWQIVLAAPLVLATGYIGFAKYAGYLWPPLAANTRLSDVLGAGARHAWPVWADHLWQRWSAAIPLQGVVASGVALLTLALLYRPIGRIASTSLALAAISVGAVLAVIGASATHFSSVQAFSLDPHGSHWSMLAAGLGPALVITLYDYYGYGQAATVSDEVRSPARVLPFATVASILAVCALYVALQIGVLGAVPWSSLVATTPSGSPPDAAGFVGSTVVQRGWGVTAARVVTLAILVTAFASTFGNLLGYSRIPYAAARDGVFLQIFGRLHASGRFPYVALLVIGLLAIPACFLDLSTVIAALTTGLVIIQSLAQIAALFALRARGIRAPYRMWLFPLPAIVAAAGWIYIFFSSGGPAIAFGLGTLAIGLVVYAFRAKVTASWPFDARAALCVMTALGSTLALARPTAAATMAPAPTYGHSALVERDGSTVFEVDRKPFFVFGAAFFYERLPRSEWAASLSALRALGINTLDLYVIWNWHETADGRFDFDGHSDPRRDLRGLLKLARADGFALIVRPGPVIRNEWRNGGYPPWLLQRPEYGMPLHDLLEGRYPPTATLQNAHSDDAAAQWLANATHMRYAERWLRRALREFAPVADRVLAVQLDDDQGAYIDNQTWPAPHLTAYLNRLGSIVHAATSPAVPLFINTYQMKVTAAAPVWAMGNWYQSDAYALGEHDRAQLEFSDGLLQTRPRQPLMLSEFQAGWLLGPDDSRPRSADPANTALALTTALGQGVRGVVNFPAQDSLYPAGMEAPFANAFYSWDAALGLDLRASARYAPTARVGHFIDAFGSVLAASRPHYDAQIAYLTSALDETTLGQDDVNAIADATLESLRGCRNASLACKLVDLRFADDATLRRIPILFVPPAPKPLTAAATARLRAFAAAGGTVVQLTRSLDNEAADAALERAGRSRTVDFAPGAVFAAAPSGSGVRGFLTLPNYSDRPLVLQRVIVYLGVMDRIELPRLVVQPRDVLLAPVGLSAKAYSLAGTQGATLDATDCPLRLARSQPRMSGPVQLGLEAHEGECHVYFSRGTVVVDRAFGPVASNARRASLAGARIAIRSDATIPEPLGLRMRVPVGRSEGRVIDAFGGGDETVVLQNALVRVLLSPLAGGRAFVFEDLATHANVFTTVGALRDDVAIEPTLSTVDRIAKYTHQFPAGMFNRPYDVMLVNTGTHASARLAYRAPDVVPLGATFDRTVSLDPDVREFGVDESVAFSSLDMLAGQRAVTVSSLAVGDTTKMTTQMVLRDGMAPAPFAADTTVAVPGNALGFYDSATKQLAVIAWRRGDIESATLLERKASIVARLTLSSVGTAHTLYACATASTIEAAQADLMEVEAHAQGPAPGPTNNPP